MMQPPVRRPDSHTPEDEGWLITFADMSVLLMSFFILMFALSSSDPKELNNVAKSLRKTGFYEGDSMHVDPVDGLKDKLAEAIKRHGYDLFVATSETPRGAEIELAASAFFDPGSAKFTAKALPILQVIAEDVAPLAPQDITLEVEGHTDDTPIASEQFPSNWELSAARAANVARYLIAQHFPQTKLRVVGLGGTHPKALNRDSAGNPIPANQDLNRRVILRIIRGEDN